MNEMIPAYKKMLEIYSAPTENKEYYQEVFDRSPRLFFDALTESEHMTLNLTQHISKASAQTFKDAVMIYNKEGDFTGEYFPEPLTEIAEHFGIERNDTNEKFFHSEAREDIKTAYDIALERLAENCCLLTDNSKEYLAESYLEDSVSEFFDAIESKACMTKAMRYTLLDYVTVYESGENYHEEDTDKIQDVLDACGLTKDYIAEYINERNGEEHVRDIYEEMEEER